MDHVMNPFLQHAVRHGQMFLSEIGRTTALSRSVASACDDMVVAIQSGNPQAAVNAAHNARIMAGQLTQSSQNLNAALNERMEMASYILNRVQLGINELAGALQTMRQFSSGSSGQEPFFIGTSSQYGREYSYPM